MHLQCCEREKVQPEDPNQPPERPDFSGMDKVANGGKTWFQAQSLQLILEVTMNRAGELCRRRGGGGCRDSASSWDPKAFNLETEPGLMVRKGLSLPECEPLFFSCRQALHNICS